MKNIFTFIAATLAFVAGAAEANAQALDGTYTVVQGNTITVQIGAAYQSTLKRATNISYTWTAANSSIAIQSKTSTTCTIKGVTPTSNVRLNYQCSYRYDGYARSMNFYYDITVKSNTISVTRVDMSPESATMEVGETLQLNATAYPTNATNRNLNWTTENYSVASVSSSGLVTARGTGRVWIWARAEDGSGAGNYCVIDVKEPTKVSSIVLSESEKTLTVGESFELTATVLPENAYNKDLKWSSDNEDVAIVSNGLITAMNPGECNITCASSDDSNVSAVCHISVQEPERYWLSVIVPNGNFAIDVTDLNEVNMKLTPDEGYTINTVTLNGETCTHDNGKICLPKLTHNSTLNIVFATETITGIESANVNSEHLKVAVLNHTISIEGLTENQEIRVYDTDGLLIKATTETTFELPESGIYILHIGHKTFKLAIL